MSRKNEHKNPQYPYAISVFITQRQFDEIAKMQLTQPTTESQAVRNMLDFFIDNA